MKKTTTNKKPPINKKQQPKFNFYWIYGGIFLFIIGIQIFGSYDQGKKEITWHTFEHEILPTGDVEKLIVVNKEYVEIYIKEGKLKDEKYKDVAETAFGLNKGPHYFFSIGSTDKFEEKLEATQKNILPENRLSVKYETRRNILGDAFTWLFPILIIVAIWIFIMRRMSGGMGGGGQIFNIGKSKATLFDKDSKVNITFSDIAGLEEAKEEVMEVVDFLKTPNKYTTLGGKIPKGALLVGAPGTGKTLLAKAMAGEAQVPFFSISGSDFVEMFVGVGASRVRDLFKQAREKAPCIIFIDEIDAVGRARGKMMIQGGNDERESTLNQLLVEMDGFSSDKGVIILAATNRPDVLDPALLRPGRFDRQIVLDKPDLKGREEIFKVHTKSLKLAKSINLNHLGAQTPGFVGADIANVCNESALIAARKGKKQIEMIDFQDAIDRVIGGLEKKSKIISPEEKKIIAYHEAGHAIAGWFLKHADPLVKVTIVPRGIAALGYSQYLPKEQHIYTTEQLIDGICMALGGRAAEEIIFGAISTGAQNDLEKITKITYSMVTIYGMNKKIGNLSYYDPRGEYGFQKPYSHETARIIDEEIRSIVKKAYERTKKLIKKNKQGLEKIAKELLKKEVIFQSDIEKLIGKRPFKADVIKDQGNGQVKKQAPKKSLKKKTYRQKIKDQVEQ